MADAATEAKVTEVTHSAADKLIKALDKLLTVQVVTAVGDGALAGTLNAMWDDEHKGAALNKPDFTGTKGAVTRVNMATGDITVSYADGVIEPAGIKALHDEAVAKGTEIFRENVRMLAEVVGALYDKLRG
jgi:hypothetical protein